MGIKVVVGVVVVAAVGVGVGWQYLGSGSPQAAPVAAPMPDECLETEWEPIAVLSAVTGKRGAEAQAALAALVGWWTPMSGWEGEVETISNEEGGKAIRMFYHTAGIVGGGFWVIAVVPGDLPEKVHRRDVVRYQGRIRTIDAKPVGPSPNLRIVLDDTRILGIRGR